MQKIAQWVGNKSFGAERFRESKFDAALQSPLGNQSSDNRHSQRTDRQHPSEHG